MGPKQLSSSSKSFTAAVCWQTERCLQLHFSLVALRKRVWEWPLDRALDPTFHYPGYQCHNYTRWSRSQMSVLLGFTLRFFTWSLKKTSRSVFRNSSTVLSSTRMPSIKWGTSDVPFLSRTSIIPFWNVCTGSFRLWINLVGEFVVLGIGWWITAVVKLAKNGFLLFCNFWIHCLCFLVKCFFA